ncbi:hypothetical protein SBH91_000464 [Pseudomonas putida]|nr:hypothetical protein [Pseudomonas putida]
MLRKIISSLFTSTPRQSATPLQEVDATATTEDQPLLAEYFEAQIAKSPLIKESGRGMVLRDFLHEAKLKDGQPLTADEKRSLGINARLKITKEHCEALTLEGLRLGPTTVMNPLYYRASFDHNRHIQLAKMKSSGITHYRPMACGDGRDCDWCTGMDKKLISVDVDFVQLINQHCTCDYCRCALQAKIDF